MLERNRKKKGITLVELIVAMAIFATVATMAVGSFVTVSRMMTLTNNMKNTQQKLRVAIEMISRLARQAPVVLVYKDATDGSSRAEMFFSLPGEAPLAASKFEIKDIGGDPDTHSLYYAECRAGTISVTPTTTCGTWEASSDLLSGTLRLNSTSGFVKTGTIPPRLTVTLNGLTSAAVSNNPYYIDTMNIVNDIVLEQIR